MNQLSLQQRRLVWAFLGLVVTGILLAYVRLELRRSADQANSMPGDDPAASVSYGNVPAFSLTNQLGESVALNSYRGQVWLADIIFTRCPGPCARMTERLKDLQATLPADPRVKLVSLTTDPAHDTPEVLARYGKTHQADPQRWHFLTGPKTEVLELAIGGLKLTALDKEESQRESLNDLFIHSTNLVLVDQQGRLRGSFQLIGMDAGDDGTPVEPFPWAETRKSIVEAVQQLLKEPQP